VSRVGSQFDFLSDHQGTILVDFIGRYEQLDIDWQKFCYLVRLPDLKLPKINTSANLEQAKGRTTFNKGDYRQYYNRTTYQIVNKIYKRDFQFFKYSEEL
jgi:midasin (ATPase involved in ribosome maturation)